jgi:hypothetical protein
MEKMIAFCGIECTACPAFIAYKEDNDELRKKTAGEWSKAFGVEIKPEHINCLGCLSVTGPHIGYCAECLIRKCGSEKKVQNCAYCEEYICDKLGDFFKKATDAKKNLEKIKQNM